MIYQNFKTNKCSTLWKKWVTWRICFNFKILMYYLSYELNMLINCVTRREFVLESSDKLYYQRDTETNQHSGRHCQSETFLCYNYIFAQVFIQETFTFSLAGTRLLISTDEIGPHPNRSCSWYPVLSLLCWAFREKKSSGKCTKYVGLKAVKVVQYKWLLNFLKYCGIPCLGRSLFGG